MKKVAIIMGSTSDLPKMEPAVEILKSYEYDSKCVYESDLDINYLIDVIKNNSIQYVKENSKYESAFVEMYSESNPIYDETLFADQVSFEIYFEYLF